ncbi:hypothetical protein L3C95_13880 [Chitinophaga filiformis]|uniref:hypothetical protein n=1 Tax=Chitinophaga filiformis TaxID=104663 RepID=UPI001F466D87|nr:hypothetical protein [Chitinophaga filiformis]MCF6403978.1 hypothetical protein [Chitinophaga filiformis]
MKNVLLFSLLLLAGLIFVFSTSHAQVPQAPLSNIEGNAQSITSKLKAALSLTEAQQPKILNTVTNFLQQRASILSLNNSNQKAYDTKLKSFQNGLQRKLKTILTPEQFTGFLELKPVNNDMTNVLSQLYY